MTSRPVTPNCYLPLPARRVSLLVSEYGPRCEPPNQPQASVELLYAINNNLFPSVPRRCELTSTVDGTELLSMTRSFKKLSSAGASKELDRAHFAAALEGATPEFISRLWVVMTLLSNSPAPTYEGFVGAAALVSKMDASSKALFLFTILDADGDSHLSKQEMQAQLRELGLSALRLYDVNVLSADSNKRRSEAEAECGLVAERLTSGAFSALASGHASLSHDAFAQFASANPHITEFIAYIYHRFYQPEIPLPNVLRSVQILVPMQRLGNAELLTDELNISLKAHLPSHLLNHAMALLYSTRQHGFSFNTLLMRQGRKELTKYFEPSTVLICTDSDGNMCGGYASEFWRRLASAAYGDASCFVFNVQAGEVMAFKAHPGMASGCLFSDHAGLAFGGQQGFHSLSLDDEFLEGKTNETATFGNPKLVPQSPFRIQAVEVWGFVDKRKLARDMEEKEAASRSVLEGREATFILDLLGKNYSEGER